MVQRRLSSDQEVPIHERGGPIISVSIDDEPSYWETIFQPFLTDYNEIITKPGGDCGRGGLRKTTPSKTSGGATRVTLGITPR
ncbi:hypothetical protein [Thermococcus sp. JCM 11816]|uniref:hypothetical protein n=1 Tax=Thermococcus sp. (strain JCM 11816 / KS-1) TaxID=1295125 RepID=UPI000A527FF9